ncbi:hypothetical protein [Brunnivagina elsteri]|uniref:hypothetical protein n=1 Tax=Brunnivagina elsteri TaxID=1247191 RepID=UPI001FE4CDE8|nr:hypothetical protein [Calothrix elsteri]
MKSNIFWLSFFSFLIAAQDINPSLAVNKTQFDKNTDNNRTYCSEQKIESVTTYLLRDLPSYANRASQRARRLTRRGDTFSYTIAAGKPEFQPLPLNPSTTSSDTTKTLSEGIEQVFFTTLERQYTAGKSVELQQFHWLLLTKTGSGWRKVMMFSQIGSFPVTKQPLSPPRESSNGVVAQAVDVWLRDCQAGSVKISSN